MQIEAHQIKIGDKGYYGDQDGHYTVKWHGSEGIDLVHSTGGNKSIDLLEATDQNWAWFRD